MKFMLLLAFLSVGCAAVIAPTWDTFTDCDHFHTSKYLIMAGSPNGLKISSGTKCMDCGTITSRDQ